MNNEEYETRTELRKLLNHQISKCYSYAHSHDAILAPASGQVVESLAKALAALLEAEREVTLGTTRLTRGTEK